MNKTLLAIFAHPDDAEIVCAGTLLLLKKAGWAIHIATMTPGDKGTTEYSIEEISSIRKAEAAAAVSLVEGTYTCLGFEDIYLQYDSASVNRTTSLLRKLRPAVVFTASPADYMVDHEMTSKIVQTACFSAAIKNMNINDAPLDYIPHLYYADPVEAMDIYGRNIEPAIYVDITSTMEVKANMLACHKSQRSWLQSHHGLDEYILSMKRYAEKRGQEINVRYAEGYRQHLGHSYPRCNILKEELPGLCFVKEEEHSFKNI
jgi:LmbE family N-acetylglucosaminyl deacetylase